jgi:Flp pilus assembly CpaE family ATPase
MSLDPDSLDIGVATATYHDMLQMVEDEKKLRKNLLEWVSLYRIFLRPNVYFSTIMNP